MDVRARLGANIRRLREDLAVSQEAFADACEIDRTYISGIERGRRNPTIAVVARIADALGVDISRLFDPDGAPLSDARTRRGRQKRA